MNSNKFPDTFWTRILIDSHLKVIAYDNIVPRLVFGRQPVVGKSIVEIAMCQDAVQTNIITQGLNRAFVQRRDVYFVYHSSASEQPEISVSAHVQYCNDDQLCVYLRELNTEDAQCDEEGLNSRYEALYNTNETMCDTLSVGVAVYDAQGGICYANQAYCQIFGVERQWLLDNQVNVHRSPILPDDVKEAVRCGMPIDKKLDYDFGEVVRKGYFNSINTNVIHLLFKGRPIKNSADSRSCYLFIIEDVTEKRNNEIMLHQSRLKTDMAMKAADIMLWEFDVESKLFYSDNEPMNEFNNSVPITIGTYVESIHPDDHPIATEVIERFIAGEDLSFSHDVRVQLPDSDEWKYCSVTGSAYQKSADGLVVKYVGTRKNNTKLEKQKMLQDKILDGIPMSIHIKDVADNFRYVFCNEESKKLFGTSVGMSTYDVLVDDVSRRIHKTDMEVFNTGVSYMGAERIILKNGQNFDTISRKSIIEDGDKRLLLTVRWDLSLQNDLQRRSKLFTLTLESMDAFTWFYEPDKQHIDFANGLDKLGDRLSEIDTLESYLASMHPDDVDEFKASLQSVVENESGIWRAEHRVDINGNGCYMWLEARGILETTIVNDAPYKYMYGMTISIDEHKQTELMLVNNKENLNQLIRQNELILNNANSGLAYITTDYMVQWANIAVCSNSLSLRAYVKGEYCYKSAQNRNSPCENCVMQRAMKSRQMEQIQFTLEYDRMVEMFATPVFNKDGVMEGIVVRADDVTERYKMIEELKCAKAMAEQSDKLKSAFLANMSHEIRTPLNAIVGFSDLLITDCEAQDRDEYIKIINNNNELLLKLIGDILDLSKIEAGFIDFKYEEFDMASYFNGISANMRQRISHSNTRLVESNPYEQCMVKLDRNRVAQLLTNYVTNAIKYTPNGEIEMGYRCVDNGIRLYVKDSGIGIMDEKKDRVFQRFAKLDEFAQGTGLGLSICKAIAESMGGSVGFESQYGVGSTFWVFLPCEPHVSIAASEIAAHTDSDGQIDGLPPVEATHLVKTILVAEDIDSNYLLLLSILKKHFTLVRAHNGQQAVDSIRTGHHCDLILMDMKMPIMDGLTATVEIRKLNSTIPIVALTAHAFESDRMAAIEAGCDDYLVKPIDKPLLISTLAKYGLTIN